MVVMGVRRGLKNAELKELHREIDKALLFLSTDPLPELFMTQKAAESPSSPAPDDDPTPANISSRSDSSSSRSRIGSKSSLKSVTTPSTPTPTPTPAPNSAVSPATKSTSSKIATKSPSSAVKPAKSPTSSITPATLTKKSSPKPSTITRKSCSSSSSSSALTGSDGATSASSSAKTKAKPQPTDETKKKHQQIFEQLRQIPNFSQLQQNSKKYKSIEKWMNSDQGLNGDVSTELLQLVEEFATKLQQVSAKNEKDQEETKGKAKKKHVAETLDEHLLNEQQEEQHQKLNTRRNRRRSRVVDSDDSYSSSSDEQEYDAQLVSVEDKKSTTKRKASESSTKATVSSKRRRTNLRSDGSSQANAITLSSEDEEEESKASDGNSSTEDEDMNPNHDDNANDSGKPADKSGTVPAEEEVIDLSDPNVYEVESVMDMKKGRVISTAFARKARREPDLFLIKWKGYDELTWEPSSNLATGMVNFYHQHQQSLYKHHHEFSKLEARKSVPNLMTGKHEIIYLIAWKHEPSRPFWEAQSNLPPRTVVLLEKIYRSSRFTNNAM